MTPSSPDARPLVVLAHGTASAAGQAVVEEVTRAAARTLGVAPRWGYVDVVEPTPEQALALVSAPVVVPLFLASGYHVRTDIPAAVASAPGAVATPAVGSGPGVIEALADRIGEVEPSATAVVLTGAGSSDPSAREEVATAASALSTRLGVPVRHAFLSAAAPTMREAYADLTGRVVIASHLLAPGFFQSKLEQEALALAAPASAPIGAHPGVVRTVVERYRDAVGKIGT